MRFAVFKDVSLIRDIQPGSPDQLRLGPLAICPTNCKLIERVEGKPMLVENGYPLEAYELSCTFEEALQELNLALEPDRPFIECRGPEWDPKVIDEVMKKKGDD